MTAQELAVFLSKNSQATHTRTPHENISHPCCIPHPFPYPFILLSLTGHNRLFSRILLSIFHKTFLVRSMERLYTSSVIVPVLSLHDVCLVHLLAFHFAPPTGCIYAPLCYPKNFFAEHMPRFPLWEIRMREARTRSFGLRHPPWLPWLIILQYRSTWFSCHVFLSRRGNIATKPIRFQTDPGSGRRIARRHNAPRPLPLPPLPLPLPRDDPDGRFSDESKCALPCAESGLASLSFCPGPCSWFLAPLPFPPRPCAASSETTLNSPCLRTSRKPIIPIVLARMGGGIQLDDEEPW